MGFIWNNSVTSIGGLTCMMTQKPDPLTTGSTRNIGMQNYATAGMSHQTYSNYCTLVRGDMCMFTILVYNISCSTRALYNFFCYFGDIILL